MPLAMPVAQSTSILGVTFLPARSTSYSWPWAQYSMMMQGLMSVSFCSRTFLIATSSDRNLPKKTAPCAPLPSHCNSEISSNGTSHMSADKRADRQRDPALFGLSGTRSCSISLLPCSTVFPMMFQTGRRQPNSPSKNPPDPGPALWKCSLMSSG
ncbi:hypothetical protein EYF80_035822 [Liparis tanakae]|uniref:Uncharacterized protein n=1 Tax=Liparis tanakae TaxID=230148 RepID=A0A4Z2GKA2_9TELE|nr:hypothetical protein EYF80_035822 [Liparis tanakae]